MQRRELLSLAALPLLDDAAAAADEAPPRVIAVLSLIGNELSLVTARQGTGSNIDRNLRQALPLPNSPFDRYALSATADAVARAAPAAQTRLLLPQQADLYERQERFFDGDKLTLPAALDAAVRGPGVSHLLLLTKLRADAAIRVASGTIGMGTVQGLGFYVDRDTVLIVRDTGESGAGFLAPFAYFRVSLVDLASGKLVAAQTVRESATQSAVRSKDGVDPWNAMTSLQKVELLQDLIMLGVNQVVPPLLARL